MATSVSEGKARLEWAKLVVEIDRLTNEIEQVQEEYDKLPGVVGTENEKLAADLKTLKEQLEPLQAKEIEIRVEIMKLESPTKTETRPDVQPDDKKSNRIKSRLIFLTDSLRHHPWMIKKSMPIVKLMSNFVPNI